MAGGDLQQPCPSPTVSEEPRGVTSAVTCVAWLLPESFKIQYLQFLAYTKTAQYKASLQQLLDQEKVSPALGALTGWLCPLGPQSCRGVLGPEAQVWGALRTIGAVRVSAGLGACPHRVRRGCGVSVAPHRAATLSTTKIGLKVVGLLGWGVSRHGKGHGWEGPPVTVLCPRRRRTPGCWALRSSSLATARPRRRRSRGSSSRNWTR